eukprot:COSAG05_NODE_3440_length_2062_cov_1.560367_3_plen_43_part_01
MLSVVGEQVLADLEARFRADLSSKQACSHFVNKDLINPSIDNW